MPKYRRKPEIVEAFRWNGHYENDTPLWVREAYLREEVFQTRIKGPAGLYSLSIITSTGKIEVDPGDWIIKGGDGETYVRKPDIFELTYEPVEGE